MATLRVRFRLNPGRKGIALGKLSKQTENIELFLRSLASDLGEDSSPNLWLATDFKNGSVYNTAEYQAVVDVDKAVQMNSAVEALARFKSTSVDTTPPELVSPVTIDRFASLRATLDTDESIGIALFDVETGRVKKWAYVDRLQLEEIGRSIETDVRYVGSVMGYTYDWNKGADKPYIIIRELNSGELVKCGYSDEDYAQVSKMFSRKTAVVIIQGTILFNRITAKSEVIATTDFSFAPDFTDSDFEQFFGCAPDLTGNMGTDEFIAHGRSDK